MANRQLAQRVLMSDWAHIQGISLPLLNVDTDIVFVFGGGLACYDPFGRRIGAQSYNFDCNRACLQGDVSWRCDLKHIYMMTLLHG